MSKSRNERAVALVDWADLVEPADLVIADTSDLKAIARLADQRSPLDVDVVDAVRGARDLGRGWSEVGVMLGVPKQAAQRRYGPVVMVS